MQLGKNCKIIKIRVADAAGTGDTLTSDTVDMQGFDGALFLWGTEAHTATAVSVVTVNGSDDDSAYAALTGATKTTAAATDTLKTVAIDVYRPLNRYLQIEMARSVANIVSNGCTVILYHSMGGPVTQGSTIAGAAVVAVAGV